ncbi:hypothetical protein HDV06_005997 [Boothiomyces sp. JEL0866]|nr:hypothetical protein HDV06_005997 [Boothiomyces sp. JEL0866]
MAKVTLDKRLSKPVETPFQTKVYTLCKQIPLGRFTTYGEIARALKTSPLAVGQALKRNPHSSVPCHRVITSKYTAHGFFGSMNNERKIQKLTNEGLAFDGELLQQNCWDKIVKF